MFRAFTLFMEEGKEPALAAGEKQPGGSNTASSKLNKDGSLNLYWGISACTKVIQLIPLISSPGDCGQYA